MVSPEGDVPTGTALPLTDSLLDLDKPMVLKTNGKESFKGIVKRSAEVISEGLKARPDVVQCPFVRLKVGK